MTCTIAVSAFAVAAKYGTAVAIAVIRGGTTVVGFMYLSGAVAYRAAGLDWGFGRCGTPVIISGGVGYFWRRWYVGYAVYVGYYHSAGHYFSVQLHAVGIVGARIGGAGGVGVSAFLFFIVVPDAGEPVAIGKVGSALAFALSVHELPGIFIAAGKLIGAGTGNAIAGDTIGITAFQWLVIDSCKFYRALYFFSLYVAYLFCTAIGVGDDAIAVFYTIFKSTGVSVVAVLHGTIAIGLAILKIAIVGTPAKVVFSFAGSAVS